MTDMQETQENITQLTSDRRKDSKSQQARADKAALFEDMPIGRAVLTLSIPTVIGSLVTVIYSMADTYFIGMINDPIQNAGVTLVAPILLAFNAVTNLFGVGSSSMMGLSMGRYDYEMTKKSSAFGFYGAVVCGLLFSLICILLQRPLLMLLGADETTFQAAQEYMFYAVILGAAPSILNVVTGNLFRAEGYSLHASIGTMSGCILNMILDPIFILAFHMGAAGAGLATCLSNIAACGYFFVLAFVKRRTTLVCMNPAKAIPNRQVVRGVFGVGIPAAIQNLLNVTSMTLLTNMTAAFGASAVAAMGIAQKIYHVPMMTALGAAQGTAPLIGYNYSSGNGKRMKEAIYCLLKYMVPFLCAMAVLSCIFSAPLMELFMKNDEVIAYGSRFLWGFMPGVLFLCIDFTGVCVYQAIGQGKISLFFAVARKIILEIPFLLILNRLFPLYGLAFAQFAAELILSIAALFMLRNIIRKAS